MPALDLNLALMLHGGFEAAVGVLLLVRPSYVFPYIAQRASYNNSERALLRWFAFSIIVQGLVAYAGLSFDAKGKRTLLAAFLLYHATIVLDAAYGYWLEGVVDELSCGCHIIMATVLGLFLQMASQRAHKFSPKKR